MKIALNKKERLERELEQLTKTYKSGIINEREYQKGKERVESKLVKAIEQVEKDQEGKKIIKDILGEDTVDEQVKITKSKQKKSVEKKVKEDKKEDLDDKDDYFDEDEIKEDGLAKEEFHEDDEEADSQEEIIVKKPVKKVIKKVKKNKKKKSKKKKDDFDNYYEDDDDSTFTKVVIFAGIICILLLLVLVRVFMDNSNVPIEVKDLEGINGTVTLEMYMDFSCEHCSDSWEKLINLKKTYEDNLLIKVKHFPTTVESIDIANAVNCAKDQGRHMQYIQRLFDNQDHLDVNSLKNFAWAEGLDVILFHSCMDEQQHKGKIAQDVQEGYDKGVRSSPTFFIDDEMVVGSQSEAFFSERIDAKLGLN
jgi:hypothetical protein